VPTDIDRLAEGRRAVEAEVAAIADAWRAADPSDPSARRRCADRVETLRDRYRAAPELFTPASVAALRAVAAALGEAKRAAPRVSVTQGALALAAQPQVLLPPRLEPGAARAVLRETFGHADFRPGQEPIVNAVLAGRDCIGVMPTGAGKSLTYQIPARLLGGTTLVVSPLIALMKDQVDAMGRVGLRATFLNSSLSPEERRDRVRSLRSGELELLYAAPEGLEASVGSALEGTKLSLIAVDEAHCISHWGHDFRPAYRNLAGLGARYGAPVLALTATATPEVTRDIAGQLGMKDPLLVRGSFLRRNLRLHAVKKGEGPRAREAILRLVRARRGESGIVYALSRRSVEEMAEFLSDHGVRAEAYHAGLEPDVRARVQDAFKGGAIDVVVATVAFGMGIDKPDIRFVLHRDLPRSIEAYYQEIGRAGRDGAPSTCVLFYSWADVMSWERMLDDAEPEVAELQRRQARAMFRLADGEGCRHERLVGHFGEVAEPCGDACDRCSGEDVLAGAPSVKVRTKSRSRSTPPARSSGSARPAAAPRSGRTGDGPGEAENAEVDLELFESLRAWRATVAKAQAVPAYVVFSDATLAELALARPRDEGALLEVKGVGPRKLEAYGEALLRILRGG
jgi:ATP-dependent DNA helicase RecQ